ncbi:MAG TPA: signal recognition particle-docking protein FtsY [Candidatus Fimivivens faecavium]|nr:signal recognition particle-docking protein FtsY [Candidatus Fimivivens faecavium]
MAFGLFKSIGAGLKKIGALGGMFQSIDEEYYEGLEEQLILADVGVVTAERIVEELKTRAKREGISDPKALYPVIREIVAGMLAGSVSEIDLDQKPLVMLIIGVNGVGKTTSIGKLAARYRREGKKVLLAAADTFRAAAIDQLQIWGDRTGADVIRHGEGSDPAAVVHDAMEAGRARGADVILCDTAGRLHNKKNLMDELSKIRRVIAKELPDAEPEVLLVLDATTGQNALEQTRQFSEAAGITGIILTKMDGTAKGGVVVAIANETGIPVRFIGLGEGADDLADFDAKAFADALFGEGGDENG